MHPHLLPAPIHGYYDNIMMTLIQVFGEAQGGGGVLLLPVSSLVSGVPTLVQIVGIVGNMVLCVLARKYVYDALEIV